MKETFKIVADALLNLSRLTGLSYNEINIIVYYLIIPMTWAALLDEVFRFHWLKLGLLGASGIVVAGAILLCGFSRFCDRLFDASATFLNSFRIIGMNYVQSSVVVCVLVPLVIYAGLIWLAFVKVKRGI